MYKGLNIDRNLKDFGDNILDLMQKKGVNYISLGRDNVVEGRSWEMAAAHAAYGAKGLYSGTVESYQDNKVKFGAVPGLRQKEKLSKELKTVYDIPEL